MRRDCTDDEGHFNHECFEEACGQYADLKRDEELEKAWEAEDEEKQRVKTIRIQCIADAIIGSALVESDMIMQLAKNIYQDLEKCSE